MPKSNSEWLPLASVDGAGAEALASATAPAGATGGRRLVHDAARLLLADDEVMGLSDRLSDRFQRAANETHPRLIALFCALSGASGRDGAIARLTELLDELDEILTDLRAIDDWLDSQDFSEQPA